MLIIKTVHFILNWGAYGDKLHPTNGVKLHTNKKVN